MSFWRSDCPSALTDTGRPVQRLAGLRTARVREGPDGVVVILTNSLEHRHSREDNSSSTSHEICCIL